MYLGAGDNNTPNPKPATLFILAKQSNSCGKQNKRIKSKEEKLAGTFPSKD